MRGGRGGGGEVSVCVCALVCAGIPPSIFGDRIPRHAYCVRRNPQSLATPVHRHAPPKTCKRTGVILQFRVDEVTSHDLHLERNNRSPFAVTVHGTTHTHKNVYTLRTHRPSIVESCHSALASPNERIQSACCKQTAQKKRHKSHTKTKLRALHLHTRDCCYT